MTLDNKLAAETGGEFNERIVARMRWQNSPLVHAIDDVVRASREHAGKLVRDNEATRRVVGAADELRILHERIMVGDVDGLGYPIKDGSE
jgi:hypothetical protein